MTKMKLFTGATIAFATTFTFVIAATSPQAPAAPPQAPQGAPAGPDAPGRAQGGGPAAAGRAGGFGRNPGAPLYADNCEGCHGVDISGGRAPSLFDEKWLSSVTDDHIIDVIKNGKAGTEMDGFGTKFDDQQLWDLVTYIHTQTGVLKPKIPFVADLDGQAIKSEKQTFKVELLTKDLMTPFGLAFLPDGRLLVTERDGRLRILDVKTKALSDPVKNMPKPWVQQDGGFLDVATDPQHPRDGWIYLSYSEILPGYVAPAAGAPPLAPGQLPPGVAATLPGNVKPVPGTPAPLPPEAIAPPPGQRGGGGGGGFGGAAGAGAPPATAGAPPAGAATGRAATGGGADAPPPARQGAPGAAGAAAGGGRGRGGAPSPPTATVIVRGKINKDNEWVNEQVLFRSPPALYNSNNAHYGSRFIFDKDGHLYFTLGEKMVMQNAQNVAAAGGKVHRINIDGSVPKDNPYVNTPGADPTVWSYGHRNPEGLAWDPVTGDLWESEHGPTNGDEINVIVKGHNYGWGVASKGSQPGITKTSAPGMDDPIVYYTPTIAPAGISFYTGDKYPGWKNTSLFVGGLAGQQLRRLDVSGRTVTHQEVVFAQFGRVRDIIQGPDGLFYVALQEPTGAGTGLQLSASTPGRVIRLVPAP